MTYCHVSAQIDRHLAEFDRGQAWQEAVEERANEIYASCESWERALELAAADLQKARPD
jgi:hypothetical protein